MKNTCILQFDKTVTEDDMKMAIRLNNNDVLFECNLAISFSNKYIWMKKYYIRMYHVSSNVHLKYLDPATRFASTTYEQILRWTNREYY